MAADKNNTNQPDGIVIPQPDAGAAFKFEMLAMNMLLGHWQKMVAVVLVILFGVGAYGQIRSMNQAEQRRIGTQISVARNDLKATLLSNLDPQQTEAVKSYGFGVDEVLRMQDLEDETVKEAITAAAQGLNTIASEATGQAQTEAYLNTAQLYGMVDDVENQKAALTGALQEAKEGVILTTTLGIAMIEVDAGEDDAALSRMTELTEHSNTFVAQQATVETAQLLADLKKTSEARAMYAQFISNWPDSERVTEVNDLMSGLPGQE